MSCSFSVNWGLKCLKFLSNRLDLVKMMLVQNIIHGTKQSFCFVYYRWLITIIMLNHVIVMFTTKYISQRQGTGNNFSEMMTVNCIHDRSWSRERYLYSWLNNTKFMVGINRIHRACNKCVSIHLGWCKTILI